MANKKNKPRERQIGKNTVQKKPLIDPKYKNAFWTAVIVIILVIFFIINNTRYVPDSGPYPPNYDPEKHQNPNTSLNHDLYGMDGTSTNTSHQ